MELACHDDQASLNWVIDLAIHLDNLIKSQPSRHALANLPSVTDHYDPMQISRAKLSLTESERR